MSVERALERIAVEEAVQPNDAWDDVERTSAVELIEKPKTLRTKRKRKARLVVSARLINNLCRVGQASPSPELLRQQHTFRGHNAFAYPIGCVLMFARLPSRRPLPVR